MDYTITSKKADEITVNGSSFKDNPKILVDYMSDCIRGFASIALELSGLRELRQEDMQEYIERWFGQFVDIETE